MIKKAIIEKANRTYQLPPDIFSFTREKTRPSRIKRIELLDLARFNWPLGIDPEKQPSAEKFTPAKSARIVALKEALAGWCEAHTDVKINSLKEVFVGGGVSNLLFTLALAFVDNGDIVFVPDLGVPLYKRVVTACGGEAVHYSISGKNQWQPDFERLSTRLGRVARLMFINSPHNPTGASLTEKELEELVWTAARENIMVVNDAAYQAVSPRSPASLLSVEGGKKVGVEVYSIAYQFGLPAFPFGFVIGNRDVIAGLELASSLTAAYIPDFYVEMALTAIRQYPGDGLSRVREHLQRSAAEATKLLDLLSFEKANYDTIPFLWARISGRRHSRTQAAILYRRARVLTAPGSAFGDNGEGYVRFSLTAPAETYQAACERIKKKVNLLKLGEQQ